jgi:hypothetical protein
VRCKNGTQITQADVVAPQPSSGEIALQAADNFSAKPFEAFKLQGTERKRVNQGALEKSSHS